MSNKEPSSPDLSKRGSTIYSTLKTLSMAKRWRNSIGGRRESVFTNGSNPRGAPSFVKVENTYQTEPLESKMFKSHLVQNVIEEVLEGSLKNLKHYEPADCQELSKNLTLLIKKAVKTRFDFPRYKLICHVMIGQPKGQAVQVASRFLWDEKTDSHACGSFQNDVIFAMATVYGLYYD